MKTTRLEAFSDGVIAILITIMVLELRVPHGVDFAALRGDAPVFFAYILSFVVLGIYWNNHHHLFTAADDLTSGVLWANLHLLFWLSLIPFVSAWMGENHFAPLPTAAYGAVLFLAGVAYYVLQQTIIRHQGPESALARAVGGDMKGKISVILYGAAVPLAFVHRAIAGTIYVVVALMWLVPDRRLESVIHRHEHAQP
jgi:uncharacterized membrane protein